MDENGPNQISVSRQVNQKRLRIKKRERRGELSFFHKMMLGCKSQVYFSLASVKMNFLVDYFRHDTQGDAYTCHPNIRELLC